MPELQWWTASQVAAFITTMNCIQSCLDAVTCLPINYIKTRKCKDIFLHLYQSRQLTITGIRFLSVLCLTSCLCSKAASIASIQQSTQMLRPSRKPTTTLETNIADVSLERLRCALWSHLQAVNEAAMAVLRSTSREKLVKAYVLEMHAEQSKIQSTREYSPLYVLQAWSRLFS